jgi:hypothetical protein
MDNCAQLIIVTLFFVFIQNDIIRNAIGDEDSIVFAVLPFAICAFNK